MKSKLKSVPVREQWVQDLIDCTARADAERDEANAAHLHALGITSSEGVRPESTGKEFAALRALLVQVPERQRNETLVEMSMQPSASGAMRYLRAVVAAAPVLH
jgi:hypothetical protein